MPVYCENRPIYVNTPRGQNENLLTVQDAGTYSNHWAAVGEPGYQSTSARTSDAVQYELSVTGVGLAGLRECAIEMAVRSAKADIPRIK